MSERRAYRRYSKEFKLEAMRQMTTSNKPITQLARELDVRVNQLYKWKALRVRSCNATVRVKHHLWKAHVLSLPTQATHPLRAGRTLRAS